MTTHVRMFGVLMRVLVEVLLVWKTWDMENLDSQMECMVRLAALLATVQSAHLPDVQPLPRHASSQKKEMAKSATT